MQLVVHMRHDIFWLYDRALRFQSKTHISPLLTSESPVAQWLEHPTRWRRVAGSNPIWNSVFFPTWYLYLENLFEYFLIIDIYNIIIKRNEKRVLLYYFNYKTLGKIVGKPLKHLGNCLKLLKFRFQLSSFWINYRETIIT